MTEAKGLRDELVAEAWSARDPICRDILAHEWFIASGAAAASAQQKGEKYHHPHPGQFKYPVGNVTYVRWDGEAPRRAFDRLMEFGLIATVSDNWALLPKQAPTPLCQLTQLGEAVALRFTSVSP